MQRGRQDSLLFPYPSATCTKISNFIAVNLWVFIIIIIIQFCFTFQIELFFLFFYFTVTHRADKQLMATFFFEKINGHFVMS